MENPYTSEPAPNRPNVTPVRLLSPTLGRRTSVIFLGPYRGLLTHFKGRFSVPCKGEGCPKADHALRAIWKGYAPVIGWLAEFKVWRPFVLEVSESMEEGLRGIELRGLHFVLERVARKGKKSVCSARLADDDGPRKCPATFDVVQLVERFYRVTDLVWVGENPVPAALALPDLHYPGPVTPAVTSSGSEEDAEPTDEEREATRQKLAGLRKRLAAGFRHDGANGTGKGGAV